MPHRGRVEGEGPPLLLNWIPAMPPAISGRADRRRTCCGTPRCKNDRPCPSFHDDATSLPDRPSSRRRDPCHHRFSPGGVVMMALLCVIVNGVHSPDSSFEAAESASVDSHMVFDIMSESSGRAAPDLAVGRGRLLPSPAAKVGGGDRSVVTQYLQGEQAVVQRRPGAAAGQQRRCGLIQDDEIRLLAG